MEQLFLTLFPTAISAVLGGKFDIIIFGVIKCFFYIQIRNTLMLMYITRAVVL